jgi:hypothetical protein
MKTVVLAALSFAAFMAGPALLLTLIALLLQSPRRPDAVGDFVLAAYLVAISVALSTLGFVMTTGLSAMWRRLAVSRAVIIAGAVGLVGPIASLGINALGAPALLPLFRAAPWLATSLFHGIPGIVLGTLALLIAWTTHSSSTPAGASG